MTIIGPLPSDETKGMWTEVLPGNRFENHSQILATETKPQGDVGVKRLTWSSHRPQLPENVQVSFNTPPGERKDTKGTRIKQGLDPNVWCREGNWKARRFSKNQGTFARIPLMSKMIQWTRVLETVTLSGKLKGNSPGKNPRDPLNLQEPAAGVKYPSERMLFDHQQVTC